MSEKQEAVKQVFTYAAQLTAQGHSQQQVRQRLVAQGLGAETAHVVVNKIGEVRDEENRRQGSKNMLIGGLWCAGGIIVTAATYSAASGGGTYVVTWGAIIFGAVQFFRGLAQTTE